MERGHPAVRAACRLPLPYLPAALLVKHVAVVLRGSNRFGTPCLLLAGAPSSNPRPCSSLCCSKTFQDMGFTVFGGENAPYVWVGFPGAGQALLQGVLSWPLAVAGVACPCGDVLRPQLPNACHPVPRTS